VLDEQHLADVAGELLVRAGAPTPLLKLLGEGLDAVEPLATRAS